MPREENSSRSRSPRRHAHERKRHRSRSRSPRHKQRPVTSAPRQPLPFGAAELSRHDLRTYRPMFALYLDIQKQIDIEDLSEDEVKGRWKSFVGKWNHGELAEGWYSPETLDKAVRAAAVEPPRRKEEQHVTKTFTRRAASPKGEEEDDDYGPALPSSHQSTHQVISQGPGPTIPTLSDLRDRREQVDSDTALERTNHVDDMRHERRLDRKVQKERLDELVPRAAAGTKERQLEKRRELADSNRAFAAAKEDGDIEVREADVMGDADSLGDLKQMKRENERKKNEREIRREEALRARREERELRVAGMKAKEEKTMDMLREIARARFGDHGVA